MILGSSDMYDKARDFLEGRYANFFKVGYNAFEFIIEFGQSYEDSADRETIHSRIVTSPAYAKNLLQTLSQALGDFEIQYEKRQTRK